MKSKIFEKLNILCDFETLNYQDDPNWNIEIIRPKIYNENHNIINSNDNSSITNIDKKLLKKIKQNIEYVYPFEELSKIPLKMAASKLSRSGEWKKYFASSLPAFMSSSNVSPVARGNAMHKFMCFADLTSSSINLDFELDKLCKCGLLTLEEISLINKTAISNFLKSSICKRILQSPKLLREHRFSVNIPIKETPFYSESKHENCSENLLFVQGTVDCAFIENNQYVIVDYKTDQTNSTLDLFNKYSSQLKIYKHAFEKIHEIKVKEIGIYSFYLSDYYYLN